MIRSHGVLLVLIALAAGSAQGQPAGAPDRPNVVLILIDDLGWADTGVYGSTFYETPHVDRLAADGMRFTRAYVASPVCSPTRSSIMSGKHPARLNQTDWIPGAGDAPDHRLRTVRDTNRLPRSEVTIAEALGDNGYVTGHIGKWHLGAEDHQPGDQGFDVNVAGNRHGSPPDYFWPYKRGDYQLEALAETGQEGEYLTTRLGEEAASFVEEHQDEPFFLYLAHYAVHTPLQAPDSLVEKYRAKADTIERPDGPVMGEEHGHKWLRVQNNPVYAAMVETMDRTVGRVRAALRAAGVAEETIVIFTSDNGGLATARPSTSNGPLRAGKGWLYEGGTRVPFIVHWPGVTAPGRVTDMRASSTDLYDTIAEMTGTAVPGNQGIDGRSLVPILRGRGTTDRERLYWHYPHYHGGGNTPSGALRSGPYKLVQYFASGDVELYDLSRDRSEQNDLSAERPALTDSLLQDLRSWRDRMDAQMPSPNPNYDGADRSP